MGREGFSLVEVLVVSVIAFSIWGALALVTTDASNRVWARTDSQVAAMMSTQQVMNRLREDLHAASSAVGATCQPGEISFARASDGTPIRYRLDAATGMLTRTEGAIAKVVGGDVASLAFPSCADVVRVALTTRVASRRWPTATHTLESQIRMQNP